jgi:hypothetical protein
MKGPKVRMPLAIDEERPPLVTPPSLPLTMVVGDACIDLGCPSF